MTATLNGKPTRKQLSDQLDRLDGIIDVLADALPQAVADACKEGARQAMKEAMLELLSNPDVRRLLTGTTAPPPIPFQPPPPDPRPNWWEQVKEKVRQVKDAAVRRAKAAATATTGRAATIIVATEFAAKHRAGRQSRPHYSPARLLTIRSLQLSRPLRAGWRLNGREAGHEPETTIRPSNGWRGAAGPRGAPRDGMA